MLALRLLRLSSLFLVTFAETVAPQSVVDQESDFEYDQLAGDYLHYDDYYLHYYEPSVDNGTLHKCLCGLEEIWNGETCEKRETVVVVGDFHSGLTVVVNTTAFGNVTIGEIVCPKGSIRVVLGKKPYHGEHFFVIETGGLDWAQIPFENYCIEHTYGPTGEANEWYAQICLEPPTIPNCCPASYSVGIDGSCTFSRTFSFSPPIRVFGHNQIWPTVKNEEVDIICSESEETFILELNNSTVMLNYDTHKPHLFWSTPVAQTNQQTSQNYCIGVKNNSETEPIYIAKVCYKDLLTDHQEKCEGKICVRKCCDENKFPTSKGCLALPELDNSTQLFNPQYHDPVTFKVVDKPENITIVHGMPLCEPYFQLRPHEGKDDEFFLLQNGNLHAVSFPDSYPPTRYCIDYFLDDDGEHRMLPLVCFHDNDKESAICRNLQMYLYPVLLIISIGFLGITLFVYLFVPELHAKVHGKCLLSHVSALLLAYVSLFIVQRTTDILAQQACKFMASVMHFSFLAAFFWLNVMCFDIWWTLKSMRPVPETGELSRLRFKLYSLYSWGCPLIIAIVSVVIQNLPEEMDVIRPAFGEAKCWFKDKISQWAYFYGFILVLVIANIVFFCQVAYILIVAQNDPILQRTRQQNRERMWLYVKLFLVMGITWLAEVISWQEGTCEAWIITDIINALQGVSIFVIFICKRKLLKKVRGKWEPYLRHVKEVVGSKRLSHSKFSTSATGTTAREQMSFSSSENRPNHSAASHRTVQSQLSFDPSSVNRKISTGSMNATTGVQVHTQNSIPMDTIAETTTPDGGVNQANQIPNGSVVLPVVAAVEAEDKTQHQYVNGDIGEMKESATEEIISSKEMQDTEGINEVPNISDLSKESGETEQESPIGDLNVKESIEDVDSNIDENIGTNTNENEKEKESAVSINASIIPVPNLGENGDVRSSYCYPFTQDNHGFTEDEDEPVHV